MTEIFDWRPVQLPSHHACNMPTERTRQLAFRLPESLIERIEGCEQKINESGLTVSRTDVVRLLLTYALNKSQADVKELLSSARRVVDPAPTRAAPKTTTRTRTKRD